MAQPLPVPPTPEDVTASIPADDLAAARAFAPITMRPPVMYCPPGGSEGTRACPPNKEDRNLAEYHPEWAQITVDHPMDIGNFRYSAIDFDIGPNVSGTIAPSVNGNRIHLGITHTLPDGRQYSHHESLRVDVHQWVFQALSTLLAAEQTPEHWNHHGDGGGRYDFTPLDVWAAHEAGKQAAREVPAPPIAETPEEDPLALEDHPRVTTPIDFLAEAEDAPSVTVVEPEWDPETDQVAGPPVRVGVLSDYMGTSMGTPEDEQKEVISDLRANGINAQLAWGGTTSSDLRANAERCDLLVCDVGGLTVAYGGGSEMMANDMLRAVRTWAADHPGKAAILWTRFTNRAYDYLKQDEQLDDLENIRTYPQGGRAETKAFWGYVRMWCGTPEPETTT